MVASKWWNTLAPVADGVVAADDEEVHGEIPFQASESVSVFDSFQELRGNQIRPMSRFRYRLLMFGGRRTPLNRPGQETLLHINPSKSTLLIATVWSKRFEDK